jgi:hypothetical protein
MLDKVMSNMDNQNDITQQLDIAPSELGQIKNFQVTRKILCTACHGTGGKDGIANKCTKCNGSGRIKTTTVRGTVSFVEINLCPDCNGRGNLFKIPCNACGGTGWKSRTEALSIQIPKNVDTSTKFRLQGKGNEGNPPGDLYLALNIKDEEPPKGESDKVKLYRIQLETAWEDGTLDSGKKMMLDKLRKELGISLEEHHRLEDELFKSGSIKDKKKLQEPEKDAGKVSVYSSVNYEKAYVVYKVKVENQSAVPIAQVKVKPYIEGGLFKIDRDESEISMLDVGNSETVTFHLRPVKECGNVSIAGKITYFDTSKRKTNEIELEKKITSIICPVMKRKSISLDEWRDNAGSMLKVEETTDDIQIKAEMLFDIVNDVLQDLNLYRLEPKVIQEANLIRAISRFYCEGVKGLKYCAYVEVVGGENKSRLILRGYAENEESLIGFYHCILDEIEKHTKIKDYIIPVVYNLYKDSVHFDKSGKQYGSLGTYQ